MYTPINQWAEDDRPREKLLLKGKSALSDSELLAMQTRINQLGLQSQIVVGSNCTSSILDLLSFVSNEQFRIFPVPTSDILQI